MKCWAKKEFKIMNFLTWRHGQTKMKIKSSATILILVDTCGQNINTPQIIFFRSVSCVQKLKMLNVFHNHQSKWNPRIKFHQNQFSASIEIDLFRVILPKSVSTSWPDGFGFWSRSLFYVNVDVRMSFGDFQMWLICFFNGTSAIVWMI